jgi:hypothetical protein
MDIVGVVADARRAGLQTGYYQGAFMPVAAS